MYLKSEKRFETRIECVKRQVEHAKGHNKQRYQRFLRRLVNAGVVIHGRPLHDTISDKEYCDHWEFIINAEYHPVTEKWEKTTRQQLQQKETLAELAEVRAQKTEEERAEELAASADPDPFARENYYDAKAERARIKRSDKS